MGPTKDRKVLVPPKRIYIKDLYLLFGDQLSGGPLAYVSDSTPGSRKIPFIKPVCRSTITVDQTTVFENFRKYPIKSVPISQFWHAPV